MRTRQIDLLETLHGLVCIYKPPDVSRLYMKSSFARVLCADLNKIDVKPPSNYLEIESKPTSVMVNIRPSYLDNRLATGPKYTPDDLSLFPLTVGKITSGVSVIGINSGIKYVHQFRGNPPVKVLQVKGKLGEATQFLYKNEKVVAKAKYLFLNRVTMDRVLSSFQAAHQRKIFVEFGLNIQSQAAYELAVQGMLRPLQGDIPTIYSVKCIEFEPPEFTLEIISINENENYLLQFIHDLGLQLKTLAHCTGIRCIRYGPFTVRDSLLLRECTLENVRKNLRLCKQLMIKHRSNNSTHLKPVCDSSSSSETSCEMKTING